MDPNEPTGQISEEEYRRRVLQLLETIESHLADLTNAISYGGDSFDVNIRNP